MKKTWIDMMVIMGVMAFLECFVWDLPYLAANAQNTYWLQRVLFISFVILDLTILMLQQHIFEEHEFSFFKGLGIALSLGVIISLGLAMLFQVGNVCILSTRFQVSLSFSSWLAAVLDKKLMCCALAAQEMITLVIFAMKPVVRAAIKNVG